MSIYVLKNYINACKVLEVEPIWQGLLKWKKQMWRD